jgi:hypothetical protein
VAMRWRGLSIHNISPANGAFNSPSMTTFNYDRRNKRFAAFRYRKIAPNRPVSLDSSLDF